MEWSWYHAACSNLRVLLLSGVWTEAYQRVLNNIETIKVPTYALPSRKTRRIAA